MLTINHYQITQQFEATQVSLLLLCALRGTVENE